MPRGDGLLPGLPRKRYNKGTAPMKPSRVLENRQWVWDESSKNPDMIQGTKRPGRQK